MKSYSAIAVTLILVFGFVVGVSAPALAASHHDDVFENEIDKDTELQVEEIEREDLLAFLEASEKVTEIRADYAERVQEEGMDAQEELRAEALERMIEAIEDAGLDEETYRGIAYHVDRDEDLFEDL